VLVDELPGEGSDEAGVTRRLGLGERAVVATGREHALERLGERRANRRELDRELLLERHRPAEHRARPRAATRLEPGAEQLVDPGHERVGGCRRGFEAAGESGLVQLHLVLVDREQQVGLRGEVPVERAGRQAGLGEHVGDRHVGRALAPQDRQPGRDQLLDVVASPGLGGLDGPFHGAIGHSSRHRPRICCSAVKRQCSRSSTLVTLVA
jgi:hypothetical protein